MRLLAERLVGKSIKSIDIREPGYGIGISLSDGAGITVNTEVTALLAEPHARMVERVTLTKEHITLHLTGNGFVAISLDRECFFDVVELFVYSDEEGFVVEN
ncbi:hypothetical protein [Mesorhizobium loti]|uniref:hypothetical protein n=1 Tax=Rhizobium loti TaxID=381 RepID=UPI00047E92C9|nr:hypothetical protein [Mesorhizobium loti]